MTAPRVDLYDDAFTAFNMVHATFEDALLACMNYFKAELARRDDEILRLHEALGRAKATVTP